jgi:uncharacterized protein (DUF983 family)
MPVASSLPRSGWPRTRTLLARSVRRRCPICGGGDIWTSWLSIRERCPTCGYTFAREGGYFLGAYLVNLIVAELITVLALVALFVWSDLSWLAVEAIIIPMAIGLPLLFFPFARMLWMALDLAVTRDE